MEVKIDTYACMYNTYKHRYIYRSRSVNMFWGACLRFKPTKHCYRSTLACSHESPSCCQTREAYPNRTCGSGNV